MDAAEGLVDSIHVANKWVEDIRTKLPSIVPSDKKMQNSIQARHLVKPMERGLLIDALGDIIQRLSTFRDQMSAL